MATSDSRQSGDACKRCGKPLVGRQAKWCGENCRKRACDDLHRASCVDCGAQMAARSGYSHKDKPFDRCRACQDRHEAARRRAKVERVAEMFREGKSYAEIAAALGYGPNSVPPELTEARRLGLIGYRNRGYGERDAA